MVAGTYGTVILQKAIDSPQLLVALTAGRYCQQSKYGNFDCRVYTAPNIGLGMEKGAEQKW